MTKYFSNIFWKCVNWEFVNKLYDGKIGRDLNETLQLRQTLNEGKSERCNRKMNEITRFIFNNNPKVKWTFKKGIDKIFSIDGNTWRGFASSAEAVGEFFAFTLLLNCIILFWNNKSIK